MKKCGKDFYNFKLSYYHACEIIKVIEYVQGTLDHDDDSDSDYWCYLNNIVTNFCNNKKFVKRFINELKYEKSSN